jgi:hypothetical protein
MRSQDAESAVLTRYAEGPEQLERALAGLDELGLDASRSPGAWTVRQIVHHIVDGDDIWKLCIKSALGNEDGEFTLAWYGAQPQEVWADRWKYSARSTFPSLCSEPIETMSCSCCSTCPMPGSDRSGWWRQMGKSAA